MRLKTIDVSSQRSRKYRGIYILPSHPSTALYFVRGYSDFLQIKKVGKLDILSSLLSWAI